MSRCQKHNVVEIELPCIMKSGQTKNYRTCNVNTDSDFYENVRIGINNYYIYLSQKLRFDSLYD